jgi:hypothetical protein
MGPPTRRGPASRSRDLDRNTQRPDESSDVECTTARAEMVWRVARRHSDKVRTPRGWLRLYSEAGVR